MTEGILDLLSLSQGGVAGISTQTEGFEALAYPLEMPTTPSPRRLSFRSVSAVARSESPFTFQGQTQVFAGKRWLAEATFPPIAGRDAAEPWNAFFLALNGQEGTFLLGDLPVGESPRGAATGEPRVKGAGQQGQILLTDGWNSNVTGILKSGDYFSINQRLYKMLQDANSDANGNATLQFWPNLRTSPSDGDDIITENPQGIFRLLSSDIRLWDVTGTKTNPIYTISFSAIEAV